MIQMDLITFIGPFNKKWPNEAIMHVVQPVIQATLEARHTNYGPVINMLMICTLFFISMLNSYVILKIVPDIL